MLVSVRAASDLRVAKFLLGMATDVLQPRDAVDGINSQTETVNLVVDRQLHWCIDVALLFIAAHVHVVVVMPAISQAVNQPRVSVEIEDDRFIAGEKRVEVRVCQTVRMLRARLQLEKI